MTYTPNYGKIKYEPFSWFTGVYDPQNAYPMDDRGKAYVKSVETVGERGIWFIDGFAKQYKSNPTFHEWFFIDNFGNVWSQRVDAHGKRMCPIKERSYTHSTKQLTDSDIFDIVNKNWMYPMDERKITNYILECVKIAERESVFDVSQFMKPLKGVKLNELMRIALKHRYIVAQVGTSHGPFGSTTHSIDNYGQLWNDTHTTYSSNWGPRAAGAPISAETPLDTARYPLLESQRPSLDCLIACKTKDFFKVSTILQAQANALYGFSADATYKPTVDESYGGHTHFYLDECANVWREGIFTPGGFGGWNYTKNAVSELIGERSTIPIPSIVKPVVDFVFSTYKMNTLAPNPNQVPIDLASALKHLCSHTYTKHERVERMVGLRGGAEQKKKKD